MWSDLKFRVRALLRRDVVERELDEELRFHIEKAVEKHMRAGMPRAEAERRARIEFGGLEQITEETRSVRGLMWLEAMRQDLRFALRGVTSRPGFTAAVVVTLGLGIGANTAMFGVVDRLLLRPPAFLENSDRVHRAYVQYLWNGAERTDRNFAYPTYDLVRQYAAGFDAVAAFAVREPPVGDGQNARELPVAAVSASFFDFFDARPVLGRFFTPAEDSVPASAGTVMVLSHRHWQSEYGGRRDVLGERLRVGDVTYTIIGVAPPGFTGVDGGREPIAFLPITSLAHAIRPNFRQSYSWSWLEILTRRRPDVSIDAATANLSTAFVRAWEAESEEAGGYPSAEEARVSGLLAPVLDARGPEAPPDSKVALWVLGVAGIVLLIAAANVINLMLARALDRRREIAVRLALGVSRARLVQQLLVETFVLAALGGIAGVLAARWGGSMLSTLFLRSEDPGAVVTDTRTLLFTAGLTLTAALLTGLAPALQALRSDVAGTLKAGARESARRLSAGRASLLLFQGALCVALLVGAGLFVRSLLAVQSLRLGYDADEMVMVAINLRGVDLDPAAANALSDHLAEVAAGMPGIVTATPVSSIPYYSTEGRGAPTAPGRDSLNLLGRYTLQAGHPDYFATTGTRILRGRGFEASDVPGAPPVMVVGQSMANAIWPGEDPLGKQLRFAGDDMPMWTVVGVAEDIISGRIGGDLTFWYYVPLTQARAIFGSDSWMLLARVQGDADAQVEAVRARLQREMPGDGYVVTAPFSRLIEPQQRSWRLGATMFAVFAALALVIAAVGLYSVAAYVVTQRRRELGIRVALGARTGDVVGMVVKQALLFAAISIALGSAAALAGGRKLEPLLFRTSVTDPLIFGGVAAVLLAVALIATAKPAFRAGRVDPVHALRAD